MAPDTNIKEWTPAPSATVNLATERAEIRFDGTPDLPAVLGAVSQAGYGVGTEATDLAIEGMTCASCVGRVERALKALPGVTEATVNLATNRARVTHLPAVGVAALIAAASASARRPPPTAATASVPLARPRFAAWRAASASLRCSPCRWWFWRWARTCPWRCTTPSATALASR